MYVFIKQSSNLISLIYSTSALGFFTVCIVCMSVCLFCCGHAKFLARFCLRFRLRFTAEMVLFLGDMRVRGSTIVESITQRQKEVTLSFANIAGLPSNGLGSTIGENVMSSLDHVYLDNQSHYSLDVFKFCSQLRDNHHCLRISQKSMRSAAN